MAVIGDSMPTNTPSPVCSTTDVLPCISSGAPTTVAPYTWPMAWWPRHTPSSGVPIAANAPMESQMMPLVSGRPGPGESSTSVGLEGDRLVDGEGIVAHDDRIGAEFAEVLDEVVHEAVVAVDHEHPGHGRQYGRPRVSVDDRSAHDSSIGDPAMLDASDGTTEAKVGRRTGYPEGNTTDRPGSLEHVRRPPFRRPSRYTPKAEKKPMVPPHWIP